MHHLQFLEIEKKIKEENQDLLFLMITFYIINFQYKNENN